MPDESLPIGDSEEGQSEAPSADTSPEDLKRDLIRFLAMVSCLAVGCAIIATVVLLVVE